MGYGKFYNVYLAMLRDPDTLRTLRACPSKPTPEVDRIRTSVPVDP